MGPSGDWAKADDEAKDSPATRNSFISPLRLNICLTLATPRCRQRRYRINSVLPGVYLIRRRGALGRCRAGLRFLQLKVSSSRRQKHVRCTPEIEAAACAKSATRGPGVSGEHAGEAVANPRGIHRSTGTAKTRRDRRHNCDVWVGAA